MCGGGKASQGEAFPSLTSKKCTVRIEIFFVPLSFTVLRGESEREWARMNPHGTRDEFDKYYENLSAEQLQVCKEDDSE